LFFGGSPRAILAIAIDTPRKAGDGTEEVETESISSLENLSDINGPDIGKRIPTDQKLAYPDN
jgi:hypothetical protein